jgi:hypothetical protein
VSSFGSSMGPSDEPVPGGPESKPDPPLDVDDEVELAVVVLATVPPPVLSPSSPPPFDCVGPHASASTKPAACQRARVATIAG